MKEDFVSHNQARQFKKLGFDWECKCYYDNDSDSPYSMVHIMNNGEEFTFISNFNDDGYNVECSAPTLAQVAKWLREIYRISVEAYYPKDVNGTWSYAIIFMDETTPNIYSHKWESYEKALSAGIDKVLELLKGQ